MRFGVGGTGGETVNEDSGVSGCALLRQKWDSVMLSAIRYPPILRRPQLPKHPRLPVYLPPPNREKRGGRGRAEGSRGCEGEKRGKGKKRRAKGAGREGDGVWGCGEVIEFSRDTVSAEEFSPSSTPCCRPSCQSSLRGLERSAGPVTLAQSFYPLSCSADPPAQLEADWGAIGVPQQVKGP